MHSIVSKKDQQNGYVLVRDLGDEEYKCGGNIRAEKMVDCSTTATSLTDRPMR